MSTIASRVRSPARPIASVGLSAYGVWASIGAGVLLLQIYAYAKWMASPLFAPSPTGDTPLPESEAFWLMFWQILLPILTVGVFIHAGLTVYRERKITIYALMPLVCGSMWWQDGLAGFYRMFIMYNSHMVNMGSWYPFIPGWINPNSQAISEPLLFAGSCYFGVLPLWLMMVAWVMRRIRDAMPTLTIAQMVAIFFTLTVILDTVAEFTWVQNGLYRFPYAIQELSLFGGQWNQYPIYESALFGFVVGGMAALFYFRDDRGLTAAERGVEKVENSGLRVILRFLALSGAFNTLFFVFYTAPVWFLSFYSDATLTNTPSYFLNGMCGKGTQYECPAPDVPMPLPGSGPMPPYTGRN